MDIKVAYCSILRDKETGEPKGSAKLEPRTWQNKRDDRVARYRTVSQDQFYHFVFQGSASLFRF